jgi:hypothetical protein
MRFNCNRANLISSDGIRLKKDGTPDMRFSVNKMLFGKKK